MPWWEAVLFFAAVIVAIWGFVRMVGVETRFWTRRTDRTDQDMYSEFADAAASGGTSSRTWLAIGALRRGTPWAWPL